MDGNTARKNHALALLRQGIITKANYDEIVGLTTPVHSSGTSSDASPSDSTNLHSFASCDAAIAATAEGGAAYEVERVQTSSAYMQDSGPRHELTGLPVGNETGLTDALLQLSTVRQQRCLRKAATAEHAAAIKHSARRRQIQLMLLLLLSVAGVAIGIVTGTHGSSSHAPSTGSITIAKPAAKIVPMAAATTKLMLRIHGGPALVRALTVVPHLNGAKCQQLADAGAVVLRNATFGVGTTAASMQVSVMSRTACRNKMHGCVCPISFTVHGDMSHAYSAPPPCADCLNIAGDAIFSLPDANATVAVAGGSTNFSIQLAHDTVVSNLRVDLHTVVQGVSAKPVTSFPQGVGMMSILVNASVVSPSKVRHALLQLVPSGDPAFGSCVLRGHHWIGDGCINVTLTIVPPPLPTPLPTTPPPTLPPTPTPPTPPTPLPTPPLVPSPPPTPLPTPSRVPSPMPTPPTPKPTPPPVPTPRPTPPIKFVCNSEIGVCEIDSKGTQTASACLATCKAAPTPPPTPSKTPKPTPLPTPRPTPRPPTPRPPTPRPPTPPPAPTPKPLPWCKPCSGTSGVSECTDKVECCQEPSGVCQNAQAMTAGSWPKVCGDSHKCFTCPAAVKALYRDPDCTCYVGTTRCLKHQSQDDRKKESKRELSTRKDKGVRALPAVVTSE